ncbi:MAG: helix-turn-helix domain-containing protein [Rhodospirillales bacterium]
MKKIGLSDAGQSPWAGFRASARLPAHIGAAVRRARKAHGWSQTVLGEHAGLRQETVSLLESGNPAAKIETVLMVLAVLDLEFQIAPRTKGSAADFEDMF